MQYSIRISLNNRELYLLNGGSVIRTFPVGIGKSSTPTPAGTYKIVNKHPNPGGPFGVLWMGLSIPDYGIHGTNNPQSIGKLVSLGCIRMHNKDVLELANFVSIGTTVVIN